MTLIKCLCGGNAKLTERNKGRRRYTQVRCNSCGRRGAVFSYRLPRPWMTKEQDAELFKQKKKARTKAIYDWDSLMCTHRE